MLTDFDKECGASHYRLCRELAVTHMQALSASLLHCQQLTFLVACLSLNRGYVRLLFPLLDVALIRSMDYSIHSVPLKNDVKCACVTCTVMMHKVCCISVPATLQG